MSAMVLALAAQVVGSAMVVGAVAGGAVWQRARLRTELTADTLTLRTRVAGIIPFGWRIPLDRISRVQRVAGARQALRALASPALASFPIPMGSPTLDWIVIERTRGARTIVACTSDGWSLADSLARALAARSPGAPGPEALP
jgi:hypothetical protein